MRRTALRPILLKVLLVAVTVVLTALALVVNQSQAEEAIQPAVGSPSPQDYVATAPVTVPDLAATEAAREQARLNVAPVVLPDEDVNFEVVRQVNTFFARIIQNALPDAPPQPPLPEETTTSTSTTIPPEGEVPAETTTTTTTTTIPPTTTTLPRPEFDTQLAQLAAEYQGIKEETRLTLVTIHNQDFDRVDAGVLPVFNIVRDEALELATERMEEGIRVTALNAVRNEVISSPPTIFRLPLDLSDEEKSAIQVAIADVAAFFLQPNLREDPEATAQAMDAAAAAVPEISDSWRAGEKIVGRSELISDTQLEAILTLDLVAPADPGPPLGAMAAVGALVVMLASFFLWRVAPAQWAKPKQVGLFGLLVVAAALASRIPALFPSGRPEFGYLIPAAFFGYVATILFDSRTAALLAIPMGTFTALSTGDLALTVFAAGATMAPVPFISSAASMTRLRVSVVYSAALLAPFAAAIAWFFSGADVSWKAAGVALANGLGSGIVALGILGPLEYLFKVTTTLTLLDLTDRNNNALRLIEEEAPGTFNHSIMVGTLAGKAARVIGANPLLAQAAAYYHDLGKTAQPMYFIENQFGISNPHDYLPPRESAAIIRGHVTEGLKLARKYRIPEEVAAGIRMHHGTGVIRFFYHKALTEDPEVEADDFRHNGEKPRGKEMAILMLSDAVEGAARALVQSEDPTTAGLRKVVDQVVAEKVEDGQLDESALTFGELSKVKGALVDALVGYYHLRIPYPGFPGTEAAEAVPAT